MPVLALIDLDHKDGRGSLHLDTITPDPILKLTYMLVYQNFENQRCFSSPYGKLTRLKPSQSAAVLLTPSHLLMFASRAACPTSGTIFLLAFQPKGRSETPLYKENSRGLSIAYLSLVGPLCCKDESLGGGVGAGAVVTEVAKDKARDTMVFLFSVIV